ncbi:MAG: hypothetical protein LH618_02320 [Saprospiraceae bacterium]|nr:hypothetical protein [Saprospiraceae bacterium]
MSEEEWEAQWKKLDWDENRTKQHLLLFVNIPEAFKNDQEWLNHQINLGLDQLRLIKRKREELMRRKPDPSSKDK